MIVQLLNLPKLFVTLSAGVLLMGFSMILQLSRSGETHRTEGAFVPVAGLLFRDQFLQSFPFFVVLSLVAFSIVYVNSARG